MLYKQKPKHIYIYTGVVDFRKQLNGLTQIVALDFSSELLADCWFVFISRNTKHIKLLYWRLFMDKKSGLCLWQYKLEDQHFVLSKPRQDAHLEVSWDKLRKFLDGLNVFPGNPHLSVRPKRYS